MRPKTQLRALPLALALAAALALAGPAAAAGRTTPLDQARAWLAGLLPAWLPDAWTATAQETAAQGEGGLEIDPDGLRTTTAGAENEAGHTIDPDG